MPLQRTLLIDADDTLWENNVYFERVATEFLDRLAARGVPKPRAEELLWQTEQRNVKITGYGSQAFCASLHEVARALGGADLEPWIAEKERWIFHYPIELMPGVRETLPLLHAKNQTVLVTKGRVDEQTGKLERSGLAKFFHAIEIVFEKNVETYRAVVNKQRLDPSATWMIGNSPRSDINPAKAAGLRTVFIPYHITWQHEIEEIAAEGPETLVLESFADLAEHFA
ncbi:MAG TPA: HAD family hydrolase [Verrucomicrobiae bacterium]|nr:HAD family hydrolase [Verrucomicrobiae bacterium]